MKELDTVNNDIELMDLQSFTVYEIRVNFIVFMNFFVLSFIVLVITVKSYYAQYENNFPAKLTGVTNKTLKENTYFDSDMLYYLHHENLNKRL